MTFTGFPKAALDFYDDLELDNTKSYWTAHKEVYDACVKAPMVELTTALEDEFGPAKIFRPYRDVRFSKDKTPYKNHQGAYVAGGSGSGWYVQISSAGVYTAVGYHEASSEALAAIRMAIAEDRSGKDLSEARRRPGAQGLDARWRDAQDQPQGYAADHPRIELLRHKSLVLHKSYGFDEVIHTPQLLAMIRSDWRATRPFVDWVGMHSGSGFGRSLGQPYATNISARRACISSRRVSVAAPTSPGRVGGEFPWDSDRLRQVARAMNSQSSASWLNQSRTSSWSQAATSAFPSLDTEMLGTGALSRPADSESMSRVAGARTGWARNHPHSRGAGPPLHGHRLDRAALMAPRIGRHCAFFGATHCLPIGINLLSEAAISNVKDRDPTHPTVWKRSVSWGMFSGRETLEFGFSIRPD